MEHMSAMHQMMSAMEGSMPSGSVHRVLDATSRLAGDFLVVLTSRPVLVVLTALLLLLANAAVLRLLLPKRTSRP